MVAFFPGRATHTRGQCGIAAFAPGGGMVRWMMVVLGLRHDCGVREFPSGSLRFLRAYHLRLQPCSSYIWRYGAASNMIVGIISM